MLSADAGPLYGMMLPNLISVSVMPGCWAEAAVRESNTARRAAGADLLDRIMLHLPGSMPMMCYLFLSQDQDAKARTGQGNGSCVELLGSRSTQVRTGQIRLWRFLFLFCLSMILSENR